MPRTRRARMSALLLALLVQAGGIAALLLEWPRDNPPGEQILIRVLPLTPRQENPAPAQPKTTRGPAPRTAFPATPVDTTISLPPDAARASTGPAPDWHEDAAGLARELVEREARRAESNQPLDSRPQVLPRPDEKENLDGVTQLDNGDVLVRSGNVVCLHSRPALAEHFDEFSRHRPARCRRTGDGQPSPLAAMEEKLKPGYLRRRP
jgi:hypothetical protein